MKEFKIEGVLSFDANWYRNKNEERWFINTILKEGTLIVHNNDIGDTVGTLKITRVKEGK